MNPMKTNIFFLTALLLVCGVLYAHTPDSVHVEMSADTVALSVSADTVEAVTYHPLSLGVPAGESDRTYKNPDLRYSNQVRVGNVSFERHNENPKPSAEPNIPMTTPDGRTINTNSKSGAEFRINFGR